MLIFKILLLVVGGLSLWASYNLPKNSNNPDDKKPENCYNISGHLYLKKQLNVFIFCFVVFFSLLGGKTTEDCKNDIRAYEFGRELHFWVLASGHGTLNNKTIKEYSDASGIDAPYDESNDCVKKGYDDSVEGKDSPYNPKGKSWNTF